MYNEEQKKRYLRYCTDIHELGTINLIEKVFNSTEMAETQFDKDVSLFNQLEVADYIKGLNSKSRGTLSSNCSQLNKYYNWCKNEEHLVSSIINPFDNRGIKNIIDGILPKEDLNLKFFRKEQFLKMLDEVIDVSNQFIAYAFYCGLSKDELINLKIGDLYFENKQLKLITGRIIDVDDLFIFLIQKTNDNKQYLPYGIDNESRNKSNYYHKTDYVIKACRSKADQISQQYVTTRMKIIKEQMGNEFISIPSLQLNGLINYIKEKFAEQKIDLKTALLSEKVRNKEDLSLYVHDKKTQQYMKEFGSKKPVKYLRMEIEDYLDLL